MCPGKRFAEIEMCAILARMFSHFSLQLEDDAADVWEARADPHGAARLENRTRQHATAALYEGMRSGYGIHPKVHVPFRIVKRGEGA